MQVIDIENPKKDDLISRQAVLDVLCNLGWGCEENGADTEYVSALEDCAEKVKELPSVKPQEPKTGRWIDGHCSECDCEEPIFIVEMFGWRWIKDMDAKYCPNCGKKMESEG